jgi:hypothetical protein
MIRQKVGTLRSEILKRVIFVCEWERTAERFKEFIILRIYNKDYKVEYSNCRWISFTYKILSNIICEY